MLFTRTSYDGQRTQDGKRMQGRGIFSFSDGSKYVGTFHDGTFHGHGIIFYPPTDGGGQFRGTWNEGNCMGGEYIFSDGLKFSETEWEYSTERDRRFWDEYLTFIKPKASSKHSTNVMKSGLAMAAGITPDYSTTDGIPEAFANDKPAKMEDVPDTFWNGSNVPPAAAEHQGVAAVTGQAEDMAEIIAVSRREHREQQQQSAAPAATGGGQ